MSVDDFEGFHIPTPDFLLLLPLVVVARRWDRCEWCGGADGLGRFVDSSALLCVACRLGPVDLPAWCIEARRSPTPPVDAPDSNQSGDVMEIVALYGHDPALMWGIATDGLNREQRRELRELVRPPEPPADAPVKVIPRAWWQADGVRQRIKRAA